MSVTAAKRVDKRRSPGPQRDRAAEYRRSYAQRPDRLEAKRASGRSDYDRHKAERQARHRQWKAENRERVAAANRVWRKRRAEHIREVAKVWSEKNPQSRKQRAVVYNSRARANGGSFTAQEWAALLESYFGRCAYCGSQDRIEVDHIQPVAMGGTNDIANLVPACRSCNASKNARPLIVFMATRAS